MRSRFILKGLGLKRWIEKQRKVIFNYNSKRQETKKAGLSLWHSYGEILSVV